MLLEGGVRCSLPTWAQFCGNAALCFLPPMPQATVYVYQLIDGQVKVDKLEFNKAAAPTGGARQL